MNTLVVLFCIVGVAVAQQYYKPSPRLQPEGNYNIQRPRPIAILRQSSAFNYDGNFNYDFQSENGITNQAVGSVKVISPKEQIQVMQGSYSYTAPDGTPITTNWYADETGFHVQGDHLPTPPAIPAAIAESLEYIRSAQSTKSHY